MKIRFGGIPVVILEQQQLEICSLEQVDYNSVNSLYWNLKQNDFA